MSIMDIGILTGFKPDPQSLKNVSDLFSCSTVFICHKKQSSRDECHPPPPPPHPPSPPLRFFPDFFKGTYY